MNQKVIISVWLCLITCTGNQHFCYTGNSCELTHPPLSRSNWKLKDLYMNCSIMLLLIHALTSYVSFEHSVTLKNQFYFICYWIYLCKIWLCQFKSPQFRIQTQVIMHNLAEVCEKFYCNIFSVSFNVPNQYYKHECS